MVSKSDTGQFASEEVDPHGSRHETMCPASLMEDGLGDPTLIGEGNEC